MKIMSNKLDYNPEFLRPITRVCDPDPRNIGYDILDEEGARSFVLEDHLEAISRYSLKSLVPEKINIQFETAKNIYLYAWYVYRFFPVSESQALSCLELALRERYKDELPKKYWNRKYDPSLRPLLSYAIDRDFIKNEGFEIWHQRAEMRASQRFQDEKIEEMGAKGLSEIEIDESQIEVTDADRNWDYIEILKENLPKIRNNYAHGSTILHNQVLVTFQVVSEIINQIY